MVRILDLPPSGRTTWYTTMTVTQTEKALLLGLVEKGGEGWDVEINALADYHLDVGESEVAEWWRGLLNGAGRIVLTNSFANGTYFRRLEVTWQNNRLVVEFARKDDHQSLHEYVTERRPS